MLRRHKLPDRLWLLDAIVEGCGGTEEDRAGFSTAWRMLTGNTSAGTRDETPGTESAQGRSAPAGGGTVIAWRGQLPRNCVIYAYLKEAIFLRT